MGRPPARGAVEASFRARARGLPAPVRQALLLVAADQIGDPETLGELTRVPLDPVLVAGAS